MPWPRSLMPPLSTRASSSARSEGAPSVLSVRLTARGPPLEACLPTGPPAPDLRPANSPTPILAAASRSSWPLRSSGARLWSQGLPSKFVRVRSAQTSLLTPTRPGQAGNAHSLEATVANLLRTGDFPVQLPEPLSPEPSGLGFLSMPIAQTYISDVRQRIIEKLVPGLSDQSALPRVFNDAIAPVPPSGDRGPPPIAGPAHNPSTSPRGQNPLSIGQSDLDPLGGRAPVVPPPFGGAASPTGGLPVPGPSRGGGMYVGPDHPLFDSRRWNSDRGAPHGPFGGDGFLPAGAVPPGARFDPVVPGIGPRGAGGPARGSPFGGLSLGLPLHGGLGRGQRGMPSGGDPDWDEREHTLQRSLASRSDQPAPVPPPGRDAGYDDMFS